MNKDEYLGDGLYASFDGYQFRLWCERETGIHEVYLEPAVVDRFMAFVKQSQGAP